ncbi:POTRA domain-containing protein, partial [Gilvimarinus sp. SDUM040013]
IKDYYTGKGYPNTTINVERQPIAGKEDEENITLNVNRGERVKIKKIIFEGNDNLTAARLRKKGMKNTKQKSINIFKSSKMIPEKFQEDLKTLVDEYKSVGFRDAKV